VAFSPQLCTKTFRHLSSDDDDNYDNDNYDNDNDDNYGDNNFMLQ
jgi:hypothetical protein